MSSEDIKFRKVRMWLPESLLAAAQREATRLDRSVPWVVRRCVQVVMGEVKKMPSGVCDE